MHTVSTPVVDGRVGRVDAWLRSGDTVLLYDFLTDAFNGEVVIEADIEARIFRIDLEPGT